MTFRLLPAVILMLGILCACSRTLLPYSDSLSPAMMVPLASAGVDDDRARFRHVFCEVNRQVGARLPDHRPCEQALVRVGNEPIAAYAPLARGRSSWSTPIVFVPGLGWECLRNYVDESAMLEHLVGLGYRVSVAPVEGLSSSARNAHLIDKHLHSNDVSPTHGVVLMGYSKGVADILEFLQGYPQWQPAVRAVVSIAGAVGGSPLADNTSPRQLNAFKWVPGADCDSGDGGAMESLKSAVRRQWLVDHPLPQGIRYYSLVAYPEPKNVSRALRGHHRKLSRIDGRNDSQLLFYDQMLPSGKLLGFLNADHLAVAVPIARSHPVVASTVLHRNAFPREVMLESVVRYLEQELAVQ